MFSCFGSENKMAEQSAEHFTRFTAKYVYKHDNNSMKTNDIAIWSVFADLNGPLSPKLSDKDALLIWPYIDQG